MQGAELPYLRVHVLPVADEQRDDRPPTIASLVAGKDGQAFEPLVVERGLPDDRNFWFDVMHALRRQGVRRIGVVGAPDSRGLRTAIETMFPSARVERLGFGVDAGGVT